MARPPRPPKAPILDFALLMRTGLVTLVTLIGAFGLFLWAWRVQNVELAVAQTLAVNTIVMVETIYLLNCRSLQRSMLHVGVFSNPWIPLGIVAMIATQLFYTYSPWMNQVFRSQPLPLEAWAPILAVGVAAYLIVGFEKWMRFRRLPVIAIEPAAAGQRIDTAIIRES